MEGKSSRGYIFWSVFVHEESSLKTRVLFMEVRSFIEK